MMSIDSGLGIAGLLHWQLQKAPTHPVTSGFRGLSSLWREDLLRTRRHVIEPGGDGRGRSRSHRESAWRSAEGSRVALRTPGF